MTTLTINLPREGFRTLEKASRRLNLIPEEMARRILEEYLAQENESENLSLFLQASEDVLAKDWDTPEEDEIWAHL